MQTLADKFCNILGQMIGSYQYQSAKAQYGKLYDTLNAQQQLFLNHSKYPLEFFKLCPTSDTLLFTISANKNI